MTRNIAFLVLSALLLQGCVSAWMTGATGKRFDFKEGMPREDVIAILGEPESKSERIDPKHRYEFRYKERKISYVEIYKHRGKINSVDEGGAQAIVNALTLGTGEIVLIPLTTVDIAKRSLESNEIYVFYSDDDSVVGFLINPKTN